MKTLTELFETSDIVWTAHRGASFEDAENTLSGFRRAVAAGADMIEFDVRMSRDGVPVILHDKTIDRTSDGTGRPEEWTLAELKKREFSYFSRGERLQKPLHPGESIPTFEEVLAEFRDLAAMNIQVYADPAGLSEICRLYLKYGMTDRGYLTIAKTEDAQAVRAVSPDIEICLTPGWHERNLPENLRKCAAFGCRFVQPIRETATAETFAVCRELGLRANVFFADDAETARAAIALGAPGFLTNRISDMCRAQCR